MTAGCFAGQLEKLVDLTSGEVAILNRLEEEERSVRRGAVVQRANEPVNELFILRHGRMMSYVLLPDGSRQILRIYFPGDFIGAVSAVYLNAPETLVALADSVLCPFEKRALRDLMQDHPRLAALMFIMSQAERVAMTDRLASLGRTSAKARVASLLLDMHSRLRMIDAHNGGEFELRLTQEEIGDALGLTAVHVNRMIRQLVDEGLIARVNSHVKILDEEKLIALGNYTDRLQGLDLGWLPPPAD